MAFMVIRRGYDRLVNLSDAVIAIAVTLLILPLADSAGNLGTATPAEFLQQNSQQLFLFVLSFAVIARFWLIHHQLYRSIDGYTIPLVWLNFLWLLTIVFLPFPTELLGRGNAATNPLTSGLYIGTMLVTSLSGLAQQVLIARTPELQLESVRGTLSLVGAVVPSITMVVAFVLAITVPGVGVWALLLLVPTGFIEGRITRHRASRGTAAPAREPS